MCRRLWQATRPAACCQLQIVFTQAFPTLAQRRERAKTMTPARSDSEDKGSCHRSILVDGTGIVNHRSTPLPNANVCCCRLRTQDAVLSDFLGTVDPVWLTWEDRASVSVLCCHEDIPEVSGMRSISLCGSSGMGLSAPSVVFAGLAPPADLICGLSKDHNWVQWKRWAVSANGKDSSNSEKKDGKRSVSL